MRGRRPVLLLLVLTFASLGSAAAAQGYSRAAERVLARAFAATGGSGWRLLRGWRETGRHGGTAYEAWLDPLRYGMRIETREPGGLAIQGFNGQAVWRIGPDGAVTAVNDHAALARARTEAFFAGGCFFFPGRFDARGDYVGVRRLGSRTFDVLRIQPGGGEPRELWFDTRTHLLARIVDRTGPRAAALRVDDYRKVGPVLVPFRFTPEAAAPGVQATQRDTLAFPPAERDRFSLDRRADLARVAQAATAP